MSEEAQKLLEKLKEKYPTHQHSHLGQCLVIPEEQFDPEWDDTLVQITTVQASQNYVYVQLPESKRPARPRWTESEVELLKEIASTGLPLKDIHKEYNKHKGKTWINRPLDGIIGKVSQLQQKGEIKHRYEARKQHRKPKPRKRGSKPIIPEQPEKAEVTDKPETTKPAETKKTPEPILNKIRVVSAGRAYVYGINQDEGKLTAKITEKGDLVITLHTKALISCPHCNKNFQEIMAQKVIAAFRTWDSYFVPFPQQAKVKENPTNAGHEG